MTLHLPPILVLVLVQWVGADPAREIGAWAALYGVPVVVALAVAETETGNVPEARRDRVVSRGNVGRYQINAIAWCPVLFPDLTRAECVRRLQDRHTNIPAGVAILARFQARFSPGQTLASAHRCTCGRSHLGGWTGHYNGGTLVNAGTRPERYGIKVLSKVRRMTAGGFAGW